MQCVDAKHNIADYLEYVGAAVPARGYGWRKIKCPFHADSHASAGVNFDENRFKCHACGVGGDVYDLIMYKEGGNYREAVKFAEAISPTGDTGIRKAHSPGSGLSRGSRANSSGSQSFSFRRSERGSSRS